MLAHRVNVVAHQGTAVADVLGPECQHEMIDGKLAAAIEEFGKRPLPVHAFKDIGLVDFDRWKLAARRPDRVELTGQLLLPGQELPARREPFLSRYEFWCVFTDHCEISLRV